MHYHLEVVLPPNANIDEALKSVLKPFSEHLEDEEESSHPFWDYWQIGGRYAGSKAQSHLSKDKLDEFYAWLQEEEITVSGITWGKQELQPADQIPKVDAKWLEMFGKEEPCTIFKHCNSGTGAVTGDVCSLKEAMKSTCYRIIIAGDSWDKKTIEAQYMIAQSEWNGVSHIDTKWDGKVNTAIELFKDSTVNYKEEWRETHTPQDDWITVTVDYHS